MVRMAGDVDSGFVAEIGPGPGSITRAILERHVDRLDVVELDERFIPPLEVSFSYSKLFLLFFTIIFHIISHYYFSLRNRKLCYVTFLLGSKI